MPFSKNATAFQTHATNSSISSTSSSLVQSRSQKPPAKQTTHLRASSLLAKKYAVFAVCTLLALGLFLMYLRKRKQRTESARKMHAALQKEEDAYEVFEPVAAAPSSHGGMFRPQGHAPPLPAQQQPPLPPHAPPGRQQPPQRQPNAGSTVALTPAELKGAPISVNESERVVDRAA